MLKIHSNGLLVTSAFHERLPFMTRLARRISDRRMARPRRRGAITVLVALLLVPFLAMVAFAVDIAWVVQSRSDLQNAADSAALAGAEQLMNGYVQYTLPSQTSQGTVLAASEGTATAYAKNFAGYNTAGGVTSLALNASDIEFGFTNGQGSYNAAASGFPNTVKVTMRLDKQANGVSVPRYTSSFLPRESSS